MDITFETKYGTVNISTSMFEAGRHDLVEGVTVKIDDEIMAEVHGSYHFDEEETTVEEVEEFVKEHCEV